MYDIHRASPFQLMGHTSSSSTSSSSGAAGGGGGGGGGSGGMSAMERLERLASENAVVIFSMSSCCMCHVVKSLLCSLGVNPTVYELDEVESGEMEEALASLMGASQMVPTVFVGGKLVGGLDQVMAAHISGSLVPQLKEAGALWL